MIKKLTFTIILSLIFVQFAISQTGETELYKELQKAEKKLDSVYDKLKISLSDINKKTLANSQNDWLKFRDSNCNFKSLKESEGGVIANKQYIDCQIQTTEIRIKELTELLVNGF
jgi:uncharacterized protein YecT (DUF1311 family)